MYGIYGVKSAARFKIYKTTSFTKCGINLFSYVPNTLLQFI